MAGPKKFGTFAGVYTPSVLTILGVIMYMRLGWVVGEAGLYAALAIIVLAHVISITTGLSISSIATDKKIKSGGIYYLLSRSLGFPMGGSIGITLFVGTALSIALYIVGFSESFLGIPAISDFLGLSQDINSYRIVGTAVLIFLVILAFISTSLALKSQFFILAAIALSLISIIVGVFLPSNYSTDVVAYSPFPDGVPLITIFAIFFPAVTGFTAGVAMSGDLKDPKKSIPQGTLWSIATGLVVYVGLAVLFAALVDRNLLVNDNNFLLKIAWSAPLVIAGIWGATLSSALGGILGGPRIIQAVAMDKIVPKFLGKGVGESNEPRNALIFTFILAEIGILIGELDAIAEIVSMFYIAAYGFINLAFALESWASTDFRPSFRIPKWVGILGFLASFGVMFQLNPGAMFASFIIMWAIYFVLKRKELKSESGDVWSSVWTSVARTSLTKLQKKQIEERNWKPNIILFSGNDKNRKHLLFMGKAFIGKFGFLSVFDLVKKQNNEFVFTKKEQNIVSNDNDNTAIFERRHSVNDIYEGITQIASTYGFSGIEPNTVFMGWARNTDDPLKFGKLIKNINRLDLNLLMMDYDKERKFGNRSLIDIWWRGAGQNGNLSLQLVKFLWQDENWANAKLRLMIVNPVNSERDEIYKKAQDVLNGLRIEAQIKIINNQIEKRSFYDIVQTESVNSDLIFMGIPELETGKEIDFINKTNRLCENIGTVILVRASSFFKSLNIGYGKKQQTGITAKTTLKPALEIKDIKIENPTVAAVVNDLKKYSGELADEYDKHIATIINPEEELIDKASKIIRKTILNLQFAADNSVPEKFKSRLSVIENKLLNDLSATYLDFSESHNDNSLDKQKELTANLIEFVKDSTTDFIKRIPDTVKIKYNVGEMKKDKTDSSEVKFFKWKRRAAAAFGIKTTSYKLYLKRLIIQKSLPEIYNKFENVLENFSNLNYSYFIELQNFATNIDHVFNEIKNSDSNSSINKEFIKEKINQIESSFNDLTTSFTKHKEEMHKANAGYPMLVINIIASDISVIHPNSMIDEEINIKKHIKKTISVFDEVPTRLYRNIKLIINNLILNNAILTAKNRLAIDTTLIKRMVSQEIENKIIANQKIVFDKITVFYNEYIKSTDKKPVFEIDMSLLNVTPNAIFSDEIIQKSQKPMKRWMNKFPPELELFNEESFNNLTNNPFDDADTSKISIRQMMDFIIQKEFLEPIKEILDEIPVKISDFNKALSDHIRLIEYTISHDDELLPDGEPADAGEHIKQKVDETKQEIETAEKYLRETIYRIETVATSTLSMMSIYPFLKAATNMKQYIKEKRDSKHINRYNKVYSAARDFVKNEFARLVFSQSSGILLTRSLIEGEKSLSLTEKLLSEYRQTHIDKDVYDKLPFYYKHLFLRKQNYSIDFLTGSERELQKLDEYMTNYRNGFKNALLITGDRHSGKSFIANVMADKYFTKENVFIINPPEGGSITFDSFAQAVENTFESSLSPDNTFASLKNNPMIVIDDFELWWEKQYEGEKTARRILNLAMKYRENIVFVFIINSLSFRVMNKVIPFEKYFSAAVECSPMNASEINEMIMIRHKIGNLKFELNGRPEEKFHTWNYAKLFNRYFTFTDGNPGLCLHTWINNIVEINGKIISIRMPHITDISIFERLNTNQKLMLMNLLIHNSADISKLTRVTGLDATTTEDTVNELISMGLVSSNLHGIYKTDHINHHRIVNYFKQNNIL